MRRTRTVIAGVAAIIAIAAPAACGGDSAPTTLSESDFLDTLGDVCSDAKRDADRIDPPADEADIARAARDIGEVYTDARDRLTSINPPAEFARDFADFTDIIDESIALTEDLERAGKDEDSAEIERILADLEKLGTDRGELAENFDLQDCAPDEEPTSTTTAATAATVVPTTATAPAPAPTPTAAPTPLTLPPTVPPATQAPVATDPPTTGQLYTVIDVAAVYNAPQGFSWISKTPDQATLDSVTNSDLNIFIEGFGVATLVDDTGTEVADVWIGVAILENPGMPASWKDLDCQGGGQLRQSDGGILGIVCEAAFESPFWEIFTATEGAVGISVYTRLPDIGGDLVADAFIEANG